MVDIEKNIRLENAIKKLFSLDTNNYIFIYTPPKVGSTTLVTSLRVSLCKSYNIIHIHDDIMLRMLTDIKDVTINEIIYYLGEQRKNVFVIDVYRTPIERKMSAYFEKLSSIHFNNTEDKINNYKLERIVTRFNKLYPHLSIADHYFEYFDIKDPIPFDFEKKYTVQIINNIKFIKLRLIDSNSWNIFLSDILNTEIVLVNDYQTDKKELGTLYKKFKEEYRLPQNFFEEIKNCKYFNFYYSEEERNVYLASWENKLCAPISPYTKEEYELYMTISLENQVNFDIQFEHYIDNGCLCKGCSNKRKEIFFKAKEGKPITEKIIHTEVVNSIINEKNQKIIAFCKYIGDINKKNIKHKNQTKFGKKFGINTRLDN